MLVLFSVHEKVLRWQWARQGEEVFMKKSMKKRVSKKRKSKINKVIWWNSEKGKEKRICIKFCKGEWFWMLNKLNKIISTVRLENSMVCKLLFIFFFTFSLYFFSTFFFSPDTKKREERTQTCFLPFLILLGDKIEKYLLQSHIFKQTNTTSLKTHQHYKTLSVYLKSILSQN